jgi:predicted AlkP superfamily phosphohydrolase/phosphomutase
MIQRVGTKASLCKHYLGQGPWDLFMVSFADPHDIAHQCWHLHDPTHAVYDAQWVERFGDPVRDVYMALDSAIGQILDQVGPQTTVILFGGPGMGPDYTGNFLFDQLLRRIDGRPEKDRNLIPHAVLSRIQPPSLQQLGHRVNAAKRLFSMSRRKCFAVPHNENAGAVRINLVGREPVGRIKPGAEYEAYIKSLTRDLLDVTNVDTGRPVIKEVVRVSDQCHGERLERLPDLFAVWARDAPIRAVRSPKVGLLHNNPVVGARTGDHNSDCVLFIQGPSVERRGEIPPVRVEDIAPTMASFFGITLPDCDGTRAVFS